MSRSLSLSLLLALCAPLAVACDKSGADAQAEANKAQEQANAEMAQVNEKVSTTSAQAQLNADSKIAAARADFATTREDYRHEMQDNIDALNKQLDDLAVKARKAKGTAQGDLRASLPALRSQRDAFVADFQSLANTTAVTFDATRARIDKEWNDLKVGVDKAD
jgi:uncharacterized phage infection (PIP) family protein YhgE